MTYREATVWGSKVLAESGIEEAELDAWLLLEMAANINRTYYYSHMQDSLTAEQHSEF